MNDADPVNCVLGCERYLVRLVPYQPGWAELLGHEADRLRAALGENIVRIEHVGSTAVPGLDAKPVLDIIVAVRDMSDATPFEEALAPLGYVHNPEHDMPGRFFFVKSALDGKSTHHLNITELGTECWFTHVAFRDHLREHPEAQEEYQTLKRELACKHRHDRVAYREGKAEFIRRLLDAAQQKEDTSA